MYLWFGVVPRLVKLFFEMIEKKDILSPFGLIGFG